MYFLGTCETSSECTTDGGSADGTCAAGFGVCCQCQQSMFDDFFKSCSMDIRWLCPMMPPLCRLDS